MAIRVKYWISDKGEILKPQSEETYNDANLISEKGVIYFAITETTGLGLVGSPMGLLLAITYAE